MNFLRRLSSVFLVLLLVIFGMPHVYAASGVSVLYQEAVMKETGERDPEAALKLYQQVIDEAGDDHRLVAKARLRMGSCYERLGKPAEAEAVYLQIIQESSASISEAVQAAQGNLEKLQAQEKKAQEELARSRPMVMVKEFQESRASLSLGPNWMRSGNNSLGEVSLDLRYRITPKSRPLAVYAELGSLPPFGGSHVESTDNASLNFNYQIHLALIAELPHKRNIIPEMGIGAAMTSSNIQIGGSSPQEFSESNWGPYLMAGLHFFPEHRLSLLVGGTYTANPFSTSVTSPAHTQSFDFPTSLWTIGAKLQLKIGWTKTVLRPKS